MKKADSIAGVELLRRRTAALAKLGYDGKPHKGLVFGAKAAAALLGITVPRLDELCEPCDVTSNPKYRSGPPVNLYDPLDLVRIRNRTSVRKERDRRNALAPRRKLAAAAAVETKRARLLATADAWTPVIPKLAPDALVARAIAHYNSQERRERDGRVATGKEPPEVLDRWIRNYLRHACTGYDKVLRGLMAKVGRDEAYDRVRERVERAIDETYPDLMPSDAGLWPFAGMEQEKEDAPSPVAIN